ncbi:hypothetical protein ACLBXM_19960 [Xanthobacteraceae bacterium A53D]
MTSRRNLLKGALAAATLPAAAVISTDDAIFAYETVLSRLYAGEEVAKAAFIRSGEADAEEGAFVRSLGATDDAMVAMLAIPAQTTEGLMFKARHGRHYPEAAQASIMNDLLRMQGLASI